QYTLDKQACHLPVPYFTPFSSAPHLSLIHLNFRSGLFATFWPSQLLVFCSVIVVTVISC
ncbi:unnamed protein product, partial [Hymenolepis diminuta]